jgi:hypothetical protein
MNTSNRNVETSLVRSREAGLAVNAHLIRITFMSDEQNLGQVHSCRIDAGSFENATKLRSKLHAWTNSGQIKLRECLLPTFSLPACYLQTLRFKILKIITLYLALYGYETRSLTLRGDRLKVFESRKLRKIFESKTVAVTEGQTKIHNGKLHEL